MTDAFKRKKSTILKNLAASTEDYADRSVKGTIDEPIRELIDEINGYDGLVTTSSCSGRVSVFLEGDNQVHNNIKEDGSQSSQSLPSPIGELLDSDSDTLMASKSKKSKGGRWLYVNHEKVHTSEPSDRKSCYFHDLFHLNLPDQKSTNKLGTLPERVRFVHFKFEPFILHVLAASPKHAHSLLKVAQTSGFRESGATSIPLSSDCTQQSITVAIRTTGLLLDCLIGYLPQDMRERLHGSKNDEEKRSIDEEEVDNQVNSLVDEAYLEILVREANNRFRRNLERIQKFRITLKQASEKMAGTEWNSYEKARNSREERRKWKKAEGLKVRDQVRQGRNAGVLQDDPLYTEGALSNIIGN